MSYDNAEPKVLKTLNSSGQVLDDAGNVINDTSDYWVQLYNQTEPKADKILKSDGTIVDAAGNLIQDTTEFNVKKYNQAEPMPAKYLHSDGTIDENPGSGGSADLEDNHQTTIDVSTYTQPVEVLPTSGKDGMKKNTVTLTNIPQIEDLKIKSLDTGAAKIVEITPTTGKDAMAKVRVICNHNKYYAWKNSSIIYYTSSAEPDIHRKAFRALSDSIQLDEITMFMPSSNAITINNTTYIRSPMDDIFEIA